ncbi:hypothetical protein WQQ_46770 [Hydrocarboniphaga effusa AP103]|uniref:Peptidase C39-like domain-containing protein n=1 Tax=Hydrocarboniphaga effusa AP103 TaxID=1172194 RepID=I7Z995_9GAMM|nr:hypothetical protein WQQ_46770 [Hydrocarboniphaga effusa AP103]
MTSLILGLISGNARRRALRPAFSLACALLFASLNACALPSLQKAQLKPVIAQPVMELTQTPFFPQEIHQCGPAALATVLGADGVSIMPESLADQVYIPGREGSLQAELISASRRNSRMAVRLAPSTETLLQTIAEGRPVLMLQNLGLKSRPAWHYAVLIGWNGPKNELILRSGRERRQRLSSARFLQTWELADRWAVVIADPSQPPPATVTPADWIAAAAPFESTGQIEQAERAYASATQRWPQESLAWTALANVRYAQKNLEGAEQALEAAIAIKPEAAALNNLAQVRLERGCGVAALEALDRIESVPAALQSAIDDTRAQARQLGADRKVHCSAAP